MGLLEGELLPEGRTGETTAVLERTSWDPDVFEPHRMRMRFPPIPISVMVRHELLDPPPGWNPE
jgi:hypothetical protein